MKSSTFSASECSGSRTRPVSPLTDQSTDSAPSVRSRACSGEINVCADFDGRILFPIGELGGFFGETTFMGLSSGFTFQAGAWSEVFYLQARALSQATNEFMTPLLRADFAEKLRREFFHKLRLRSSHLCLRFRNCHLKSLVNL